MKNILIAFTLLFLLIILHWLFMNKNSSKAQDVLINNSYKIIEDKWVSLIWCAKWDSIFTSRKFIVKKDWIQQTVRVCCWLLFKWCTIRF